MFQRLSPCLVLILAILAAGGCAGSAGGDAFQPEVVEPSRAVIYIYRAPRGLWGRAVRLYINQEPVGDLFPGQYRAKVLGPGVYLVRVEADSSMVREVRLVPGDVAYLQVNGGGKPTLEVPDSDQAQRQLARSTRAAD